MDKRYRPFSFKISSSQATWVQGKRPGFDKLNPNGWAEIQGTGNRMNAEALPEFTPDQRAASNTGAAQASATVELALPGHGWRPPPAGEGLNAAAPSLPAQVWTAMKSGRLWRAHRGAQRLRGSRHCLQGSSRAGPWITGGWALICSPASTRSYMRR